MDNGNMILNNEKNTDCIDLKDFTTVAKDNEDFCRELQAAIEKKQVKPLCLNGTSKDEVIKVFKHYQGEYLVDKYVGVLFYKGKQIVIRSRFDEGDNQNFLNYVFSKVFDVSTEIFNVYETNVLGKSQKTWEYLLIIAFFEKLKTALSTGFYKEYVVFSYNDSKLKGSIDVARQIKENPLFRGTVSYNKRENTVDNAINHLILATYHYILKEHKAFAKDLLTDDLKRKLHNLEYQVNQEKILNIKEVLQNTNRKVTRHIFVNYEKLREISQLILRRKGVNIFDKKNDEVHGVLIDMTRLWEVFLGKTVLEQYGFQEQVEHRILLNDKIKPRVIRPDFVLDVEKEVMMVLDAKYKFAWSRKDDDIDKIREDLYQIMSYMLAMKCSGGGAIFPVVDKPDGVKEISEFTISAMCDSKFYKVPICINQKGEYREFVQEFEVQLKKVTDEIKRIVEEIKET